jgi:hypothetical protein
VLPSSIGAEKIFGLRRQAERDAALEKDSRLIYHAKALSSVRAASALQKLAPMPRYFSSDRLILKTRPIWCNARWI